MRKHFLYLFYAVTSGFILLALHQDITLVLKTSSSNKPQYVFSQITDDNAEKRKQEDMDIIRQWAKGYDPSARNHD
ncbi:hypothetical protein [Vibrio sp. F74]|uniref:hypothetical protein n=1 Tax=Vibrio sp. F74 TaxID=700020 RepID=UPI0035F587AE